MYVGTLPPVSNRATWSETIEFIDDDVDEPFDVSEATEILMHVRNREGSLLLSASLTDETIEHVETGKIRFTVDAERMASLCAQTCDIGIVLTFPEDHPSPKVQFLIGQIPVIEGVAR
jgi:hypothetical protein